MNIISKMAIAMASLSAQSALWAINHSRSWYSYPTPTKRISGHAKRSQQPRSGGRESERF